MSDTEKESEWDKYNKYPLRMRENTDKYKKSGIKLLGSVSLKGIL